MLLRLVQLRVDAAEELARQRGAPEMLQMSTLLNDSVRNIREQMVQEQARAETALAERDLQIIDLQSQRRCEGGAGASSVV